MTITEVGRSGLLGDKHGAETVGAGMAVITAAVEGISVMTEVSTCNFLETSTSSFVEMAISGTGLFGSVDLKISNYKTHNFYY